MRYAVFFFFVFVHMSYAMDTSVTQGVEKLAQQMQEQQTQEIKQEVAEVPTQEVQESQQPAQVEEQVVQEPAQEVKQEVAEVPTQEVQELQQPVQVEEQVVQEPAQEVKQEAAEVPTQEVQESQQPVQVEEQVVQELVQQDMGDVMPDVPSEEPVITQDVMEKPEDIPEDEIQGIDTMGLEEPRGNWLFKRIWWERSEDRYDKIRRSVEMINELRVTFFTMRTELEKMVFDPFYLDIGFKQGELQGVLSELVDRLEKEREQDGMLDGQERELFESIQQERELLLQLNRDAQSVMKLDHGADDVINRVMEQRGRVAQYEQEAWGYMRAIARLLSDKEARDLFYKMDAAWRNIKNINRYLETNLYQYFIQLMQNARAATERIKAATQALKEKGIDLKQRMENLEEQDELSDMQEEEEEEVPVRKPKKKSGVIGMVSSLWSTLLNILLWLPRKFLSLFFG